MNLPLIGTAIRFILAIPSFIIVAILGYVALFAFFLATFVILFRGRYPRGIFGLIEGYIRWQFGLNAYLYHLFDEYPPFGLKQRGDARLQLDVPYPEHPSRLLNAPVLGQTIKTFLLIPHLFILYILGSLVLVVAVVATLVILFKGSYPAGMHGFVVGVTRWNVRVYAYLLGLTDRYPPLTFEY
jgi:hypothetical protein